MQILPDQTGCGKFNMAASEPEIPTSQLPSGIETKFQRLNLHFRGPAFEWDWCKYCPTKPDVVNPIWQPPNTYISASRWDSNEFPMAVYDHVFEVGLHD